MPQYFKIMKTFLISIKITLVFCVVLFVFYVLVLCGFSALVMPGGGEAQAVSVNNKVVGISNIAQQFTGASYFWPRPSAVNYNGSGSGGSNKGVTNKEYLKQVSERIESFLQAHPYLVRSQVPAEMVTASGSGLDPHISLTSAMLQAQRIAQARGMKTADIQKIIEHEQENPFLGTPIVNVLKLNIALDEKFPVFSKL